MTCAKRKVVCVIETPDGKTFAGENWCSAPQKKCPRKPGEGYKKCKSICQQHGHAEIDAIDRARGYTNGATATLIGHTYACKECQETMFAAGISWFRVQEQTK